MFRVIPGNWRQVAPSLISAVRMLLLPLVWHSWRHGQFAVSMALYAIAALSDCVDGVAARRLGTASALGAFFDTLSDIVFLLTLLLLLGLDGVVPIWLFLAPLAAAIAFFATSQGTRLQYDPIGKHFGGALYALIAILLYGSGASLGLVASMLICAYSALVVGNRFRLRRTARITS